MISQAVLEQPHLLDAGDILAYRVGPLLYTPALRHFHCRSLRERFGPAFSSLAFCLEDSIRADAVEEAQRTLRSTLQSIRERRLQADGTLLFVRVRSPEHLQTVRGVLGDLEAELTGYILPKFDRSNAERYVRLLTVGGASRPRMLPILESGSIADAPSRLQELSELRSILDTVRPQVLNVRVGGNDLCNLFGVRRSVRQTIYDIAVVRDILSDILGVFAPGYVVAAPVWEYFGEDPNGAWARGLRAELALDRLNGFVGKTAIHPSQLEVIRQGMQVAAADYEDAVRILGWQDARLGVQRSADGSRMNELSCHAAWARRTVILGQIYGVQEGQIAADG